MISQVIMRLRGIYCLHGVPNAGQRSKNSATELSLSFCVLRWHQVTAISILSNFSQIFSILFRSNETGRGQYIQYCVQEERKKQIHRMIWIRRKGNVNRGA